MVMPVCQVYCGIISYICKTWLISATVPCGSCACRQLRPGHRSCVYILRGHLESKCGPVDRLLTRNRIERLEGATSPLSSCLLHGLLLVPHRLSALGAQPFAAGGTHLLVQLMALAVVLVVVVRHIGQLPGHRDVAAAGLRLLLDGHNVQLRRVSKHCVDVHGRRGRGSIQRGTGARYRSCGQAWHLTAAVLGHVSRMMRLDGLSGGGFGGATNGVFSL